MQEWWFLKKFYLYLQNMYYVFRFSSKASLGNRDWKLTRIFFTSSVWFFAPMMIWNSKSSFVVLFGSWQITLQAKMLWKLFSLPSQPKLRILWNSIHFLDGPLISYILQSRIVQAKHEKYHSQHYAKYR